MSAPEKSQSIFVWDIWTRIIHWLLAGCVLFLLISGFTGFLFVEWHRSVGEWVLALLVFRLLWGLVGSSNVRFKAIVQSPFQAVSHLRHLFKRSVPDTRGHNAAGGWAIVAMLALLIIQASTGLFIADEDEIIEGALYGTISSKLSSTLLYIHHLNVNFVAGIVGLHVAMIFIYRILAGKNLLTPMLSGKMRWPADKDATPLRMQRVWVGVVCVLISVALVGWIVGWALPFSG